MLGVDNDKAAMETFRRNHDSNTETYTGEISDFSDDKFKKIEKKQKIHLICGGPPCQGLSTVGEGIPDDPRNFLFLEFLRAVRCVRPDFVVIENVTGITARKNEKIVVGIREQFRRFGYDMKLKVLSADRFGVPQRRRRTIFIGNMIGKENIFPNPDSLRNRFLRGGKNTWTVGEAFADLKSKDGLTFNHDVAAARIPSVNERRRIKCIPEGGSIRYKKDEDKFFKKHPELKFDVDWEEIDEGRFRQKKLNRLDRKKPSPTIMTDRHTYYHPTKTRYLTAREAAKIQSFPNEFVFEGTIAQQWRQIGNAVPPLLGKAIGDAIIKSYARKKNPAWNQDISTSDILVEIEDERRSAFNYKEEEQDNTKISDFVNN